jgi:hypothetical protein
MNGAPLFFVDVVKENKKLPHSKQPADRANDDFDYWYKSRYSVK